MKTATVKVKGFSRSTDLKMISVQADEIKSVNRCQVGQQGTTAIFEVNSNPASLTEMKHFQPVKIQDDAKYLSDQRSTSCVVQVI